MRDLTTFLIAAAIASSALAHDHAEVLVGHNSANRLVPHIHEEMPVSIPESIFAGIPGYATGLIGFESLAIAHPEDDLFLLSSTAHITATLVSFDAGARIYDSGQPMVAGGIMDFLTMPFDYHPIFCIPNELAEHGEVFTLNFVLHDLSGQYLDSDMFSLTITPEHHGPHCDSIDFNHDSSLFDPQDIDAFLSVYSEGPCVPETAECNDIDYNNDGSVFDPCDISAFLLQYAEGPCTMCGE